MLTLNDGTIIENSSVIESGNLYVYIGNGMTLAEVFEIMNDPEKTKKIVYDMGGTYRGYKKLIAVRDEQNGTMTAVLKK